MLKKSPLLALAGALALLLSACVNPATLFDDDAADGDQIEAAGGATTDDAAPVEGEGEDDGTAVDGGDLPEIDLPDGMTSEEGEQAVRQAITGDVPPEVEECVARRLLVEPGLAVALIAADANFMVTDLPFEDQVTLAEITIDCSGPELLGEFLAQGFAEGSGDIEAPPEMIDCFERRLTDDDGPLVFVGLAAVGEEQPPEVPAQEPLIDTLTECVSGGFLATVVVDELSVEDPTFASAVDPVCVDQAYASDPEVIRPLWTEFVLNPQADFTDVSPTVTASVFAPLFNCISFGSVLAGEFADLGVDLSQSSIDCIDVELMKLGFFETILAGGEPSEADFASVLLTCLSAAELAQLGLG
ncbi:MAG: hypothetical protein AAF962_16920 [Actinomycetota bacterium]